MRWLITSCNISYMPMKPIEIVQTDITTLAVDAIVNAANSSLLGGGGVDGAIHRAAGPKLLSECRTLNGCPTGQAKITLGYKLPAKFVIHTVGPVYRGGNNEEAELLKQCYENSLKLAVKNGCETIAFPAISCGVYGYPIVDACQIAWQTIVDFQKQSERPIEVILACFGEEIFKAYKALEAN